MDSAAHESYKALMSRCKSCTHNDSVFCHRDSCESLPGTPNLITIANIVPGLWYIWLSKIIVIALLGLWLWAPFKDAAIIIWEVDCLIVLLSHYFWVRFVQLQLGMPVSERLAMAIKFSVLWSVVRLMSFRGQPCLIHWCLRRGTWLTSLLLWQQRQFPKTVVSSSWFLGLRSHLGVSWVQYGYIRVKGDKDFLVNFQKKT